MRRLSFSNQYEPIRDSLELREQKMNSIIVPLCICFSVLSLYYVVKFFYNAYYTPENGLYYYQVFFEASGGILLLATALITVFFGKSHPQLPRYLLAAVYLFKAVSTTVFCEFDYFILYIIPITFAIGYYNLGFSILTNSCTLVCYVAAELLSTRFGIIDYRFCSVDYFDETLFRYNFTDYALNRIVAQTLPTGLMLLFVCLLCVFLTKIGADALLRENKVNSEKAALDRELYLGSEIQQSMLPDRVLENEYYSAFSYMVSAKNVGGDFFDYFPVDDSKVLITIGDVSGKGISASLFSSNAKALIRAYASGGLAPDEILSKTNISLCSTNKKKLFVTIWLGILDLSTGEMTYCNAGHNPPVLKRSTGESEFLRTQPNFVIGRRAAISYVKHSISLSPGDSVVLYTDGVTEAMNGQGQLYGEEKLLSFVSENPVGEGFTKSLRKSIFDFKGEAEQSDDISVACLTYSKAKPVTASESFKAVREDFPRLCKFVTDFAADYTSDGRLLNDIELSLGEIFSNLEFYSSSDGNEPTDVSVQLSYASGMLSITFADNGKPFNPLSISEPSAEHSKKNKLRGGFGIFMVKKLMDDMSYEYNGSNILTLKKYLKEKKDEN